MQEIKRVAVYERLGSEDLHVAMERKQGYQAGQVVTTYGSRTGEDTMRPMGMVQNTQVAEDILEPYKIVVSPFL